MTRYTIMVGGNVMGELRHPSSSSTPWLIEEAVKTVCSDTNIKRSQLGVAKVLDSMIIFPLSDMGDIRT